ncbi:hypothetical protein LTR35_008026 [Friedmanniomyces endolithicus]|uniref:Aminotransferase n=1 Tax=Friedmanniomyces endolithicus TaxID=329885 RepID=A0AAN6J5A8_9PEZI|nr:hypothetical protein LTS00_013077 [Friedmanniomyces endolithicus]KAK0280384.1 hypothetical protein LTR35_008026 [Friedmanniomyces endolithicus]KAK0317017.1 hypothetical protein LTR82_011885 [Friedmanniomyces endolithicus]KAK1017839.1 hypothetical protein LTR54_001685 [Friedmanniomyces endolithicus]
MSPMTTLVNDGNLIVKPISTKQSASSRASNGGDNHHTTSAVLHRSLHHIPLRVESAKGHYLHLSNGQSIFDATGGAAVACLGHGNERQVYNDSSLHSPTMLTMYRVRESINDQMKSVSYCHSLFYATPAAEDLARLLVDSTGGEMARAFFISSGSEAIEAALKLARQYFIEKKPAEPHRTQFIARHQSYHGTTLGALAVGGHVARRALYEPLLSGNNSLVSPCYSYRGLKDATESEDSYVRRLETELDAEFHRLGPHKVAAFVAEPVVGAALGCVPPIKGYFEAVRRVCDRHGALLILDEIMCGSGRTGPVPTARYPKPLHAWQDPLVGVLPDIMVVAKGLGGGYMPIAAMLANHKVMDALQQGSGSFGHGQTYQGHPLACRAALEVQRIVQEQDLVSNVRKQGVLLGKLLKARLGPHPAVGDVRGKGLFWGIEFVRDKGTKEPFAPSDAVAMGIHELGMQEPNNISLYPGTGSVNGCSGDHILIAPAYTVTAQEIQHLVDVTARVIELFFQKHGERYQGKSGGGRAMVGGQ